MEEQNKENEFNEEAFRMKRIHELQSTINATRYKFFSVIRDEYNLDRYGFQIIFSALEGLFFEVSNLLTADEFLIVDKKHNECLQIISNYVRNSLCGPQVIAPIANQLGATMYDYELIIRKMHLKHGLSGKIKRDVTQSVVQV